MEAVIKFSQLYELADLMGAKVQKEGDKLQCSFDKGFECAEAKFTFRVRLTAHRVVKEGLVTMFRLDKTNLYMVVVNRNTALHPTLLLMDRAKTVKSPTLRLQAMRSKSLSNVIGELEDITVARYDFEGRWKLAGAPD